ncbi:MAG: hypothetical protein JWN94_3852 [Betaproteobacteria bacterium]|nr:hypothetical protein [Betaproteobacteria bacterium]
MNVPTMDESSYRWKSAADSASQLICLLDREGRVIRVNRTMERWTLKKAETVRGILLHELLHRNCSRPGCYLMRLGRPEVLAKNRHLKLNVRDPVLNRQVTITTRLCNDRSHSDYPDANAFAVVTIDEMSEFCVGADRAEQAAISERYRRETGKCINAEHIHVRLLEIFDKTPSLVAIADHSGMVCYLNPAGRELLKFGADVDVSGVSLAECHAPSVWRQIEDEAIPRAESEGIWRGDSVLVTRDGAEIKTTLTLIAHRGKDGSPEAFTFLEWDMSDWIRTEEALVESRNQLRRLSAQHLSIQEMERKRVASDLHDGLGQSLSLLKMKLESAVKAAKTGAMREASMALQELVPRVTHVMDDLRNIAMNLRPAIIDEVGVRATMSWFIREIEESGTKVKVDKDINVAESDVPQPLKIAIFRILQEAANNALKHAQAERLKISLGLCNGGEVLELCIEDDGAGFDPLMVEAGALDHGLGLQSMRERAELLGGSFALVSRTGKGTQIRVRWPRIKEVEVSTPEILSRTGRMMRSISKTGLNPLQDAVMVKPPAACKGGLNEVVSALHAVP